MELGDYLRAALSTPWRWGEHDCSAWPARWAGVPIPAYSTEAEAAALIESAGGLIRLWESYGAEHLQMVSTPAAGDIGVIEAISAARQVVETGAIFTGRRWAFIPISGGLATASADALRTWRPRCLR